MWYFCHYGRYLHIHSHFANRNAIIAISTSLPLCTTKDDLLNASLKKEIVLQQNFFEGETIHTIYLGGGTPSMLNQQEMMRLLDTLHHTFSIASDAEITLEANPDDLHLQKIKELKQTPVNRFSIGVQSFQNADLQFMNRAHSAKEALGSIKRVQDAGWENITIDLIYGTPTLSDTDWQNNLQTAINLAVPHISAYALTVEENTALHHFIEKKNVLQWKKKKALGSFYN